MGSCQSIFCVRTLHVHHRLTVDRLNERVLVQFALARLVRAVHRAVKVPVVTLVVAVARAAHATGAAAVRVAIRRHHRLVTRRAAAQLLLLGAEQVAVRCVRDARLMGRVRRVPRSGFHWTTNKEYYTMLYRQRHISARRLTLARTQISIVHRHDDGSVLLGHGRDRIRVVRIRQMFLGVEVRGEDQRLAIAARNAEATASVAYRELNAH